MILKEDPNYSELSKILKDNNVFNYHKPNSVSFAGEIYEKDEDRLAYELDAWAANPQNGENYVDYQEGRVIRIVSHKTGREVVRIEIYDGKNRNSAPNPKTNIYKIKCIQTKTIYEDIETVSKQDAVKQGYEMIESGEIDFDFVEPEYKVLPPHKMNESIMKERRMNLGAPWHHWTEVYNIFETISDMYSANTTSGNVAKKKIDTFYDIFKGIKEVDQAYSKWNDQY
jgi:hypothetical protein